MIGAIRARLFFAFLPKELSLQFLVFAAEMLNFSLQFLKPPHRFGMHALPETDELPQFTILPLQPGHIATQARRFRTQLGHFLAQLRYYSSQIRREIHAPGTFDKHAFHDKLVFTENPDIAKRPTSIPTTAQERLRRSFTA
jgi:hypothetical protein